MGARARLLLEQLTMRFAAPIAVLRWQHDGHDVHERWRSADGTAVNWLPVVEAMGLEVEAAGRPAGTLLHDDEEIGRITCLAVPLFAAEEAPSGWISLVVHVPDESSPALLLGQLAGAAALVNTALLGVPAAKVADVASHAAHQPSLKDLAIGLVGTLRARTGCVQVAFGSIERGRARLLAVSGIDEPAPRSAGSQVVRQAMEECADLGVPIVCPPEASDSAEVELPRLHEQWRQDAGFAALLSIPIRYGSGRVAVVSLMRAGTRSFTPEEIEQLQQVLLRLAPSLEVLRRSGRGLKQHVIDRGKELASRAMSPSVWRRRLPALAALGFFAWVLFGTMDHTVVVPCVVESTQVTHIGAPREARLTQALVREGDQVRKGDVLCRFDDTELVLSRAELTAEIASLEVESRQHVAAGDLTSARLVDARRGIAEAKLAAVENRIEQTTIVAADTGRIVRGDLSQRIGQVMPQGEPLFELAKSGGDAARLAMHVPEHEALDVTAGAPVRFVSNARPDEVAEFRVDRLVPAAEVVDGRNVFRAVAHLDGVAAPEWTRPGMEGVAEVALGRRPVRRVLADRIDRWVRGWFRP